MSYITMRKYIPSKNYHPEESKEAFVARLRQDGKNEQFIQVKISGKTYTIRFAPSGFVSTKFGRFQVIPCKVMPGKWGWQYILAYPDVQTLLKKKKIILRLDSACYTGMVLGDTVCDCARQLREAQKFCVDHGGGIIVHLPAQDGKGQLFTRLYRERLVHELGVTWEEYFELFAKEEKDLRTFEESAIILKALGFAGHSFELATQNKKKISAIEKAGMKVSKVRSI